MPVIAIVNRKGGSGKSTLAAHLAAWCAHNGSSVMLGDIDRQQSARAWLKRRPASLPAIAPWALDQKNMLRVPTGISHVVLDTPGGLHGFELARIVMFADAIVMPVCNSMFDRESAASCHAELAALPRVASGRCRLVTVGMRVDGRTNAAERLADWSEAIGMPYLGSLRETQLYMRSLERGMTIFDLPPNLAAIDLKQWEPILKWLQPVLYAPQAANDAQPAPAGTVQPSRTLGVGVPVSGSTKESTTPAAQALWQAPVRPAAPAPTKPASALPMSLMPAQESMLHGARLSVHGPGRATAAPVMSSGKPALSRNTNSQDGLQIPQFLKRAH